jgi:hypothetical protein
LHVHRWQPANLLSTFCIAAVKVIKLLHTAIQAAGLGQSFACASLAAC